MHETEYKLLTAFKENSNKSLSTSHIVKLIYPQEWKRIDSDLNHPQNNKEKIFDAKREKAQLHRRILYYLSKLVKEEILQVTKESAKGQKHYALTLGEGEEFIIEKYKRKIIISKPKMPSMPIEGYEQKGMVIKYSAPTWIDRVNSVIVECPKFKDLKELYTSISKFFSNINDGIALNHFESLLANANQETFQKFYSHLINECENYGKKISLIIDSTTINPEKQAHVLRLLHNLLANESEEIVIVLEISVKDLQTKKAFFKKIIELFTNARLKTYFKNKDLHKAPYFIGKAGPYTFNEREWQQYRKNSKKEIKYIICSQSTVVVDVDKFFETYNSSKQFRAFIMNITKSFLSANSLQRKGSSDYFKELLAENEDQQQELFSMSRNFIRFWNYGWKQEGKDQDLIVDLFESARQELDKFTNAEDIIYLACGMPTRFKVCFASAFSEFTEASALSKTKYRRTYLRKIDELYTEETLNSMKPKEKLFKTFDGGDVMIIHRIGVIKPESVLRELNVILSTYEIPFFAYDFGESHKGDLKLSSFFE
ncbi:hypothetical protein HN587_02400 [Candidatus Woesearchaeota archaeon]|jgi:hypothetical protein|nr:hypothetical protein [Candidatus Woesearchaeota archaeon]